jgi:hypothetical protein
LAVLKARKSRPVLGRKLTTGHHGSRGTDGARVVA